MTPRPYMRRRQANQLSAQQRLQNVKNVMAAGLCLGVPDRPTLEAAIVKLETEVKNACPKCGKALKPKGRHFHIRKCHGDAR